MDVVSTSRFRLLKSLMASDKAEVARVRRVIERIR